jgi:hypothetical protein
MTNSVEDPAAQALFDELTPRLEAALVDIDRGRHDAAFTCLTAVRGELDQARQEAPADSEQFHNDIFVLRRWVDLITSYGTLWQRISLGQFSDSWSSLQDCLDLLRTIKRFSEINVSFFEDQLLELEAGYPYGVFASVGMLIERFDCSICGEDIDSDKCPHMRGELYQGEMAAAVAHNITRVDHVSLVLEPEDKRCVVQYDDASDHFKLLRALADLINRGECQPREFSRLERSTKRFANPDYRRLGRNDLCFCGSSQKFKKCCIDRSHVEKPHVDIVAVRRSDRTRS